MQWVAAQNHERVLLKVCPSQCGWFGQLPARNLVTKAKDYGYVDLVFFGTWTKAF